jgi:hypothetical protein
LNNSRYQAGVLLLTSKISSAWLNTSMYRVGRLHVHAISDATIRVETCNVQSFQLSTSVLKNRCDSYELYVDDSVLIIPQVDDVVRFHTTECGKWQVSVYHTDCTHSSWNKIVNNWLPDDYASTEPYTKHFNLCSSYNLTGRQRDYCREPVRGFTYRSWFAPLSQIRLGVNYGVCRLTSKQA